MPDRFEYDSIDIRDNPEAGQWYADSMVAGDYTGDGLIAILDRYGAKGWEVVHVDVYSRSPYGADVLVKRRREG